MESVKAFTADYWRTLSHVEAKTLSKKRTKTWDFAPRFLIHVKFHFMF